jgi:hypothetical protein
MPIERGSDIEALLMLCALADPKEAQAWLNIGMGCRCPIASAANTVMGRKKFTVAAADAFCQAFSGEWEGGEPHAVREVRIAADSHPTADPDIRAALEAMFPR